MLTPVLSLRITVYPVFSQAKGNLMKEFIEFISKHLVDTPDSVIVEEKQPEEKKIVLTLKVGASDVGKVIGKQGKTAQAMRTLLTAIAAKEGKRAILEILE